MADTFRVVMRNETADYVEEAVDPQVPAGALDAYLSDARTRWAEVTATPNDEE